MHRRCRRQGLRCFSSLPTATFRRRNRGSCRRTWPWKKVVRGWAACREISCSRRAALCRTLHAESRDLAGGLDDMVDQPVRFGLFGTEIIIAVGILFDLRRGFPGVGREGFVQGPAPAQDLLR